MTPVPESFTDAVMARYPDRKLERGPIVFYGPFSQAEINELRSDLKLSLLKERPGPHYRRGHYFAIVQDMKARHSTLMKTFKAFLNEVGI